MRILPLLLVPFLLLPFTAKADMIPDGQHIIKACLTITNMQDFPDYDFIRAGIARSYFADVMSSEKPTACFQGMNVDLYAIKKTDQAKVTPPASTEEGTSEDVTQMKKNAGLFLPFDVDIAFNSFLPDTNPVAEEYLTVHIVSITDAGVDAEIIETEQRDKNGATLAKTSTPAATTDVAPSAFPLTEAALVVLGCVVLVFAYRTWKK